MSFEVLNSIHSGTREEAESNSRLIIHHHAHFEALLEALVELKQAAQSAAYKKRIGWQRDAYYKVNEAVSKAGEALANASTVK